MPSLRPERPRLRKREIAFALALGLIGAGGAAIMLESFEDSERHGPPIAIGEEGPDALTYEVGEFNEITIAGSEDVIITLGDTYSVRSEGDPRALAQLQATVEDGNLYIGPGEGFNWNRGSRLTRATFTITVPSVDFIALAGSGNVRVDRIEGERFSATVAGPGTLTIGNMTVDETDLSVMGSGNIVASGTAGEASLVIGGSGEIEAAGLHSENASVRIGGSGDVALSVSGSAKMAIGGSGDVDITGTDDCSLTRVGGGVVRCNGAVVPAN